MRSDADLRADYEQGRAEDYLARIEDVKARWQVELQDPEHWLHRLRRGDVAEHARDAAERDALESVEATESSWETAFAEGAKRPAVFYPERGLIEPAMRGPHG